MDHFSRANSLMSNHARKTGRLDYLTTQRLGQTLSMFRTIQSGGSLDMRSYASGSLLAQYSADVVEANMKNLVATAQKTLENQIGQASQQLDTKIQGNTEKIAKAEETLSSKIVDVGSVAAEALKTTADALKAELAELAAKLAAFSSSSSTTPDTTQMENLREELKKTKDDIATFQKTLDELAETRVKPLEEHYKELEVMKNLPVETLADYMSLRYTVLSRELFGVERLQGFLFEESELSKLTNLGIDKTDVESLRKFTLNIKELLRLFEAARTSYMDFYPKKADLLQSVDKVQVRDTLLGLLQKFVSVDIAIDNSGLAEASPYLLEYERFSHLLKGKAAPSAAEKEAISKITHQIANAVAKKEFNQTAYEEEMEALGYEDAVSDLGDISDVSPVSPQESK